MNVGCVALFVRRILVKSRRCNGYVQVICGVSYGDGYGSNIMCILCNQTKDIEKERDDAFDGLVKQSKKMKFVTDKYHSPVAAGNMVLRKVLGVDYSKSGPCDITVVMMEVYDNQFYKLGTKTGNFIVVVMLDRNLEYVSNHLLTLKTFYRK